MLKRLALDYTYSERASEVAAAVAAERSKTSYERATVNGAYEHSQEVLKKTEVELREVKKKVREQSEADMVLVAIKLIAGAIKGESKESLAPLYNQQSAYNAQMQAMGATVGSGYSGNQNRFGFPI